MIIRKKMWPEYYDAINSGKKKFDFRLADFDVNEGDTLILQEWDPETKEYTGRAIEKKITFVGKFDLNEFNQRELIEEKGFVIMSLE